MATAATSLLGLALPVTGELSGTWGDTVNVSITALLDSAVAGTTTLSSDADVTLTTTTLAANQARQAIILWTAGGTVTRTITAPAQSKAYIVINKTSSSQSIKIVGAGPTTGVTIVAGTAAFVVWNGVDFVTASVTSTTGVLPVANGGTGLSSGTSGGVLAYTATGTLASSAALAASALVIGGGAGAAPSTTTTGTGVVTALGVNTGTAGAFVVNGGALGTPSSATLTNATGLPVSTGISGLGAGVATFLATPSSANLAAAVTDETGTGALVFATSPTLVTPALGTPASGVVTNLTGTASININGTVGATTASTGAFTTLTTSSTVTHNGGTANGVAYLNGSKVLTTGSALTFDGTNLSVGTTALSGGKFSALADLTAVNGLVIRDSATTYANNDNYVLLQNSTGVTVGGLTHPASGSLGVWGNDDIRFLQSASATEAMRLTSTGLGIGTSSPQTKIQATGSSAGAVLDVATVRNDSSDANSEVGIFFNPSNNATNIRGARISAINNGGNNVGLKFYTGTGATITSKMTLDFSGNLGIGTSSPDANLTVNGAASFAAGTAALPSIARAGDLNTGIFFPAADTIAFSEGGAEAMRIDSSGNVGIGTSLPGAKLQVNAGTDTLKTLGTSFNQQIHDCSTGFSQAVWQYIGVGKALINASASGMLINTASDATAPMIFATGSGATERMRIDSSGNVLVTGAGGLGYGTGSGGTVTQATSRTTGVTLNKTNGAITLVSAAGLATFQSFTVTNSTVAATDVVHVTQKSGTDLYQIFVTATAAGSFRITFATTGGITVEQPVFNFAVIKAVTA